MSLVQSLEAVRKIESDLFAIDIDGTEIIFTLPSYKKASQYARLSEIAKGDSALENIFYEYIFVTYVEDKFLAENEEDMPAGIPHTIAKLILFLSGTDENNIDYSNEILDTYREGLLSVINIIKTRICRAFPGYKFSDIDKLNYQEILYIYVQAEQLLIEASIIEPTSKLKLVRPGEEEKEEQFNIEKAIARDAKEYGKFNEDMPRQRITDSPEYKARLEQLNRKYGR